MLKFLEIVSLAYMTNGIELGTGAVPADEFNLTNFKLQVVTVQQEVSLQVPQARSNNQL